LSIFSTLLGTGGLEALDVAALTSPLGLLLFLTFLVEVTTLDSVILCGLSLFVFVVKNQREKQESAKSNSPHVNHNRHSYSGTVEGTSAQNKPAVIGNSKNVNKDTKTNKERPQSLTESKVVTSTRNVRNINSPRGEVRAATSSASKPPVDFSQAHFLFRCLF
jgi:hypothetical protein